jgi:hypothetical protein
MLYKHRQSVVITEVTHIYLNYAEENFTYEKVDVQNSSHRPGPSSSII